MKSNSNTMLFTRQLFISICFLLIIKVISAQNPLVKDIGMSDPHMRVFNDSLYLFCGHDSSPDDKLWVMKEWRVFSSADLVDWKQRATISPKDNYMDDNSIDCWAADASTRDGKYYFYFSDRKRGVGVMQADSPIGPYTDALGDALVSPMHDPTLFVDDNKKQTPYLLYGDKEGGGFHIAKLKENMVSLAHKSKPIKIVGEEWESAPNWMDKSYLFKYKDTYYLSWGRDYATSKNIYGPYKCVGAVGNGHNLNEFAHGSFFWWKGQFYHMWCYYIRPGFKYRETIITYCHFNDEGKIVSDTKFLDEHFENGVGQYNADWDIIEAEWYYEKSTELEKQSFNDGFEISNITEGSWLRFANVDFDKVCSNFSANVSGVSKFAKIEITLDSPDGEIVGAVSFPQSNEYKTVKCKIKELQGKRDIYLKFTGVSGNDLKIDWFNFY